MKEPALANMAHVYQACIAILTNQKQKPWANQPNNTYRQVFFIRRNK